jgi:hypothetical protein
MAAPEYNDSMWTPDDGRPPTWLDHLLAALLIGAITWQVLVGGVAAVWLVLLAVVAFQRGRLAPAVIRWLIRWLGRD